jgi:hypothetical protein
MSFNIDSFMVKIVKIIQHPNMHLMMTSFDCTLSAAEEAEGIEDEVMSLSCQLSI